MAKTSHYTPYDLAKGLVDRASPKLPRLIADFCVGDGRLIMAAMERWPEAKYYANDIDADACASVRKSFNYATVTNSDFLTDDYHKKVNSQKFDLILLNPPFSKLGQRSWRPFGEYSGVKCSLSMAFVLTALPYLEPSGELLAIMPTSSNRSDLDTHARKILKDNFACDVLTPPSYGLFPRIAASVYNLRVTKPINYAKNPDRSIFLSKTIASDYIIRGNISLPKSQRLVSCDGRGWIHTTSLSGGEIKERYNEVNLLESKPKLAPPSSVLVPRVGKIRPDHIAITKEDSWEALSDCILAARCVDKMFAAELRKRIINNFEELKKCYSGTGAPYITASEFLNFLIYKCKYLDQKTEFPLHSCGAPESWSTVCPEDAFSDQLTI